MKFLEFNRAIKSVQFLVERDVANAPSVKEWVLGIAQRVRDATARKWFQSQLFDHLINVSQDPSIIQALTRPPADAPDWLYNKIMSGGNVYNITPTDQTAAVAAEVVDWVNAWADEHPGARINYTWEQAEKASVEWHKELAQGQDHGDEQADDTGLAVLKEYPDGFRWVDVKSEVCLKREGGRMGHCVGSYGGAVSDGSTRILSLRSPKNTPHVTIEVNDLNAEWWMAQNDVHDPDQIVMDFMKPKLMAGDTVGKINQIKGKQNKPPVPKYIPYVKDLLDSYPFGFTSGGEGDLGSVGWYVRGESIVSLKEIARPFHKLSNGQQWVGVEKEDKATEWGSLKLVDKNWTPLVSVSLQNAKDQPGKYTLGTWFTVSGNSAAYHDQLLEMIRGKSNMLVFGAGNAKSLHAFNIFVGPAGVGTPKDAAGKQFMSLPKSGLSICKMYDFNTYYSRDDTYTLYLVDQQEAIMGMVEYASKHYAQPGYEETKSTKEVVSLIRLIFNRPYSGDYITALVEVSTKLKMPIYEPERFGIDGDGNRIDVIGDGELLGSSENDEYEYHLRDDQVIVVKAGDTVPLAIVELDENGSYVSIVSGLYTDDNDSGLLGYIRIDLNERRLVSDSADEDELRDMGWIEIGGDYIYARGAGPVMVHVKTYEIDNEGNEVNVFESDSSLDEVDEYVMGGDEESYLANYATLIDSGSYDDENVRYNENDDEFTEFNEVRLDDSRDVKVLTYYRYDQDAVAALKIK